MTRSGGLLSAIQRATSHPSFDEFCPFCLHTVGLAVVSPRKANEGERGGRLAANRPTWNLQKLGQVECRSATAGASRSNPQP